MITLPSEPCLYFVRGFHNNRVTPWIKMKHPGQDSQIDERELRQQCDAAGHSSFGSTYWKRNPGYRTLRPTSLTTVSRQPLRTYDILKLPVRLVKDLTEDQALYVVGRIEDHIVRVLDWKSQGIRSLAVIHHLPLDIDGARSFYKNGEALFKELALYGQNNPPEMTLAHKFGLMARRVPQISPTPGMNASAAKKSAPPPSSSSSTAAAPAPAPAAPVPARKSATHNLHRKLGLKGGHPAPGSLKTLKRIWNAQKGETPAPEATADVEAAPATPKPETPTNG